jgi:acyl homoserine lactone synthase
MQTTTLSFENIHNHGELFANMLRARRELFIVHNKWDLPEALGMEYDQYDTPASRWVVVHDDLGRVMAGNRLTPTTARCGIYSYMIRDAQRGLLNTIPSNLLYAEAPVAETVWESSRLFVALDTPAAIRRTVHARLISELAKASRLLGATSCLTLLAANWPRWAGRVGVDMTAMGPVMEIDGIDNQVVSMDFSSNLH